MSIMKASRAAVEADTIEKGTRTKHHQTNTHNAQTCVARKNVEVKIIKQYPTQVGNTERPPAGSVHYGDSATISSRKVFDRTSKKTNRKRSIFENDVTIDLKRKTPASSQKKAKPRK